MYFLQSALNPVTVHKNLRRCHGLPITNISNNFENISLQNYINSQVSIWVIALLEVILNILYIISIYIYLVQKHAQICKSILKQWCTTQHVRIQKGKFTPSIP